MTNEQARKLLGGYATNSLTEAERKALFEAALDDQELFDALQQEQALKELLSDPVSRNQIQQALVQAQVSLVPSAAWWSRWWVWGSVAGAVAAAVLIVAVIRLNDQQKYQVARITPMARITPPPEASAQRAQPASSTPAEPNRQQLESAPRKVIRPPRVRREPSNSVTAGSLDDRQQLESALRKVEPQAAPAPPPPPPPSPQAPPPGGQQAPQQSVQVQAATPQVQTLMKDQFERDSEKAQAAKTRSVTGARPGAAGFLANFKQTLLRYSLVKRDAAGAYSIPPAGVALRPGDAVRLNVTPMMSGYLSVYRLDASGEWKRLYPASDPGLLVSANATQSIPDFPIIVTEAEQKLRLTLLPTAENLTIAPAPQTVDITIAATASKVP
jgi:hypothetical protein